MAITLGQCFRVQGRLLNKEMQAFQNEKNGNKVAEKNRDDTQCQALVSVLLGDVFRVQGRCTKKEIWMSLIKTITQKLEETKNWNVTYNVDIMGPLLLCQGPLHIPQKENLVYPKSEEKQDNNDYTCQNPFDGL